jgi:hypothetical protein
MAFIIAISYQAKVETFFLQDLLNSPISNLMKTRSALLQVLHVDGHDKTNQTFFPPQKPFFPERIKRLPSVGKGGGLALGN